MVPKYLIEREGGLVVQVAAHHMPFALLDRYRFHLVACAGDKFRAAGVEGAALEPGVGIRDHAFDHLQAPVLAALDGVIELRD